MKTIAEHLDYIKSFFPEYFEDGADVGNVDTEETPNNDDVGIADGLKMEHSILKLVCGNIQP